MERQREPVVFCVSVAGAHCLKIKGLRSKASTTAVWLLHILGYSAQILLREIREAARMCAKHFFIPNTFLLLWRGLPLLALTDHVYWRCGENPGWDPGVNWISKGKCLLDVSQIHLHRTALLSNNCLLKLVLYIFYNRYSLENTYLSVTLICDFMLLLHYMSKQRVYSLQYVYLIILVTCYFADSDFM